MNDKLQRYREHLKSHDWFHAYSDDGRVYNEGRNSLMRLTEQQRDLDRDFEVWNEYAPGEYKVAAVKP